jgi:hypothetical protein
LVDIANTPWDYACRLKEGEMGCLSRRCRQIPRGGSVATGAENLSNVLTGLILNGLAVQNANGTAGLSTGGFSYVSLSANIRNQG